MSVWPPKSGRGLDRGTGWWILFPPLPADHPLFSRGYAKKCLIRVTSTTGPRIR